MVGLNIRISLAEFLRGLEQDEVYGVDCYTFLQSYAEKHHLEIGDSISAPECLKKMVDIWLKYEHVPFYRQGSQVAVELDKEIRSRDFLKGHSDSDFDFEIDRFDLKHFLLKSNLPLPAPGKETEISFWFHGNPFSTEPENIMLIKQFEDNERKVCSLCHKKEEIERDADLDMIEKQKRLEELATEIKSIEEKQGIFIIRSGAKLEVSDFLDNEAAMAKGDVRDDNKKEKRIRNTAKMAVEKLFRIAPKEVLDYQTILSHQLSGVDQSTAIEWCRYFAIKNEYDKIENQKQTDEFLVTRKKNLRKEMRAINEWVNFERDIPTDGVFEVLEEFSSEFFEAAPGNKKQNEGQVFVPVGTEWYDIRIYFVDDKNIEITPGRGRKLKRSYKDFDCFYNKKSKNPRKAWWHLVAMALYKGNPSQLVASREEISVKHISVLQIALKGLFPEVNGYPFEESVKGIGWKPRLNLTLSSNFSELH